MKEQLKLYFILGSLLLAMIACGIYSTAGSFAAREEKLQEVAQNGVNPPVSFQKTTEDHTQKKANGKQLIIIDPGHGGRDGGKVGINQVLEKNVNLQISMYLADELKANGYEVILTRQTDAGLYKESDTNKKTADLNARCDLINREKPLCFIGIHQNSYTGEGAKGAQVFYYAQSEDGRALAKSIQESLIANADPDNHRVEKGNGDYYMLLHTDCLGVMVECGFLSNREEAAKLAEAGYQKKVAKAICTGIRNYFKNR